MLNSSLVNNTDFKLSKLRYLIFNKSKFVSLFLFSTVQGSPSCCTSCTYLQHHATSVFAWACRLPYSGSSYFIHCIFCHRQGTASVCVLHHSIYSSLPFSSHCYCPFTAYYYHYYYHSACSFLLSQTLLYPLYCLGPLSTPTVTQLSRPTLILVH